MTTQRLFQLFKKNNTKGMDGVTANSAYKAEYGNMSFEESFEIYLSKVNRFLDLKTKIDAFEKHLINLGIEPTQSAISESRYYRHQGNKYRFSGHKYPTGSMTDLSLNVYDFAADPELINDIQF